MQQAFYCLLSYLPQNTKTPRMLLLKKYWESLHFFHFNEINIMHSCGFLLFSDQKCRVFLLKQERLTGWKPVKRLKRRSLFSNAPWKVRSILSVVLLQLHIKESLKVTKGLSKKLARANWIIKWVAIKEKKSAKVDIKPRPKDHRPQGTVRLDERKERRWPKILPLLKNKRLV